MVNKFESERQQKRQNREIPWDHIYDKELQKYIYNDEATTSIQDQDEQERESGETEAATTDERETTDESAASSTSVASCSSSWTSTTALNYVSEIFQYFLGNRNLLPV